MSGLGQSDYLSAPASIRLLTCNHATRLQRTDALATFLQDAADATSVSPFYEDTPEQWTSILEGLFYLIPPRGFKACQPGTQERINRVVSALFLPAEHAAVATVLSTDGSKFAHILDPVREVCRDGTDPRKKPELVSSSTPT